MLVEILQFSLSGVLVPITERVKTRPPPCLAEVLVEPSGRPARLSPFWNLFLGLWLPLPIGLLFLLFSLFYGNSRNPRLQIQYTHSQNLPPFLRVSKVKTPILILSGLAGIAVAHSHGVFGHKQRNNFLRLCHCDKCLRWRSGPICF
jgi:hypothetical protein